MLDRTAIKKEQRGGQNQGLNILSHTSRQGRNKHSVVKSHLSRQYEVELMELKNLMAKQQAEQQLKDRQIQLEN